MAPLLEVKDLSVKFTTDDGIVGHGLSGITEEDVIAQIVNHVAGPAIVGDDPLDPRVRRHDAVQDLGALGARAVAEVLAVDVQYVEVLRREREILPRSERASSLFARYSFFTPVYRTYRNMDSFDLGEDQQLGPDATAQVAAATDSPSADHAAPRPACSGTARTRWSSP